MNEHWKTAIARIVQWKQIAHENDKLGALPWHFPGVGSNQDQVSRAEAHMRAPFSEDYRTLLALADGWRGFYISTDLFGTEDFLSGRAEDIRSRSDVQNFIIAANFDSRHVIPVGASDSDIDVFLLISEDSPQNPCQIIWIAGTEVDRYTDFEQFFEAMVNYNAQIAQRLASQQQNQNLTR